MAVWQAASFGGSRSTPVNRADALRRMTILATLLDSAFVIPGTSRRIGLDGIIGLVPGIGDAVTTLMSAYLVWEARQLGLPKRIIARMIGNVALDGVVGAIPFAGDVFDVVFKANLRNVKLVRDYLDRTEPGWAGTAAAPGVAKPGPGETVIDAEYRVVGGTR